MSENEEIEVANAYLFKYVDGVLNIKVKPNVSVDIDIAKEVVKFRQEQISINPSLTLLDVSAAAHITKEARDHTSGDAVEGIDKALAIVTNSLPTKILANFFIKLNKPPQPTKMFHDENSALVWLETFR